MLFLFCLISYFACGGVCGLYICMRYGCDRNPLNETVMMIAVVLLFWPIVLTAPYWIVLFDAIAEYLK